MQLFCTAQAIRAQVQNYTIEQQDNLRDSNRELLCGYFVKGTPGIIMENICATMQKELQMALFVTSTQSYLIILKAQKRKKIEK